MKIHKIGEREVRGLIYITKEKGNKGGIRVRLKREICVTKGEINGEE